MSRSNPSVDILIIAYNQEKYIDEAIEGAVSQTYENVKVIIADDCSTDGTRAIIDDWYDRFPEKIVRVYNEKNLGITGNSNAGLAACKGDFFVIMGGDDVLYKDKIKAQLDWLKVDASRVLCGHRLDLINSDGSVIGDFYQHEVSFGKGFDDWIKSGMLFGCMGIMVRSEYIRNNFDQRLVYASDFKFFVNALGQNGEYGFLKTKLGAYRKHGNSITATASDQCLDDFFNSYVFLKEEYPRKNRLINKGISKYHYRIGMRRVDRKDAISAFMKAISFDIFNPKPYARLLQRLLIGKK